MEDKREDAKEAMPTIDLSLAINYLPAVECICKAAIFAGCLCLVNPAEHLGAFAITSLMLNIDRSLSCARIFDGNSLHFAILLSWFLNSLRSAANAPAWVLPLATWLWCAFGAVLLAEPKVVQEYFVLYGQGGGGRFRQILPALINGFFVGFYAFLPMSVESNAIKMLRTMGFCCLCVCWVYIVTVWRPRPRQQVGGMCVFAMHALIARFSPVLYVYPAVAVLYGLVCASALVYHYVQLHLTAAVSYQSVQEPGQCAPICHSATPRCQSPDAREEQTVVSLNEMSTIDEEDEGELEEYFRSALQQKQAKAP